MVENQHGLGSILSFSAKSVNPKILEALLVGREKIVKQLENRVKNIANDGLNHQVLIIGARGTGKTHILRVLYYRLKTLISKEKIKVAYFAEEEYGISGYLDFMVRILNAFIRWYEDDAEFFKKQLTVLQETPSSHQEETIKRIIRDYIGDKPLLILAENFNDILDALKKGGQSKLRNWLQENSRISIIATSQALSDDIGKEDKPFYGFFDEITLRPLTLEESFQLLKSLAKIENREDVIEHLENKGEAQVKAINSLVKGNHRLLITFYQFLKSDVLSNLSVMFIKTLNDLKPYYETFIRYQPPQQQKIIRFLALAKTPQKGVDISRECFIDQKSLSKQLSELSKKKLIDIVTDPDDKRNKLYDISEPLLRISIEIGEQKEGISALFIDFLALYYNQNELKSQKKRFSKIMGACNDPKEKQQYSFEINARNQALELQNRLKEKPKRIFDLYKDISAHIRKREFNKANALLNTFSEDNKDENYYYIVSTISFLKKNFKQAKKELKIAINLNPNISHYWLSLGILEESLNNYNDSIISLKKAIQINPKEERAFNILGEIYSELKEYSKAIESLESAISINPNNEETLSKLAEVLYELDDFNRAKEVLKKALDINPNNELNWLFIALVYGNLEEYENAIKACKKARKLNKFNVESFWMQSILYQKSDKLEKAIPLFYKTISVGVANIISDNKIDITIISDAINDILKYDTSLTKEKCLKIENSILNDYKNPKELQISLILVQTFRKVILENQEKALYNLPKEQREFFQKEIVDFRNKNN